MRSFIALGILALAGLSLSSPLEEGSRDRSLRRRARMSLPERNARLLAHAEAKAARMAEEDPSLRANDDEVPIMIAREGYPCESHTVITDDCYILEMHRIPYGKNSPLEPGVTKPAVYLQHGLLCSSADWVMGIAAKSLGYILADAGFDVWMGNYRGNHYSREHCELNPDRNDFWFFSWDHNGNYDIPAMIDTVLQYTGQEKIHYVGHSMGTTALMVMLNDRPEYAEKLIMANLLAPVAYMENMRSPIRLLVPFTDSVEWIAAHLGLGEFLPDSWIMDVLAELVCEPDWLEFACESVLFLLCGFDPEQTNDTLVPIIVHHTPAGTSTFTVLQYAQEVETAGFHHYDYGSDNGDHYTEVGPHGPPEMDPTTFNLPLSLYWSNNDWMAEPIDVQRLADQLPDIFDNYEVPFAQWNHLDYMYGIDADTLVYAPMIENMWDADADYQAGRPVVKD